MEALMYHGPGEGNYSKELFGSRMKTIGFQEMFEKKYKHYLLNLYASRGAYIFHLSETAIHPELPDDVTVVLEVTNDEFLDYFRAKVTNALEQRVVINPY